MRDPVPKGGAGGEAETRDAAQLQLVLSAFGPNPDTHFHESGYFYSDGVKFLADSVGAYWLLDAIFARQRRLRKKPALRTTQVWVFAVEAHVGTLTCLSAPNQIAYSANLGFTDFPLPEITLHIDGDLLCLPSEH
jgi:hypothetical protein